MASPRLSPSGRSFRFDHFEVREREGELFKNGVRLHLQEQPLRVLVELLANAGRVVTREELQKKLWPADTFVDFDVGLNTAIHKLRQALGDDADQPRYIETLARKGYRFLLPVKSSAIPSEAISDSAAPHPVLIAPLTASGLPGRAPPKATVGLPSVADHYAEAAPSSRPKVAPRWLLLLAAFAILGLLVVSAVLVWHAPGHARTLLIEQRVTSNPPEAPIFAAVISPDGKYLAYSDSGGTYIRDIDSGETRPLRLPKGFDAVPSSWFPDSMDLLFSSGLAEGTSHDLWRVSILGGSPRMIMEHARGGRISPDGSQIAFFRGAPNKQELWLVGVDGSNSRRILASAPTGGNTVHETSDQPYWQVATCCFAWSPRGQRLGFIRFFWSAGIATTADTAAKVTLETVDVNSGRTKVLIDSPQLGPEVSWSADGRLLYSYREQPGTERGDFGIWSLPVNEKSGEAEGKPQQLTQGVGRIGALSISANGKRLLVGRANTQPEIFVTEIDAASHRLKTPRRLTLDENGNVVSTWTPDSRSVVFTSNRNGTWELFRQEINQTTPEVLVEGRSIFLPRLNPDGTQILYLVGYRPGDATHLVSLMRLPLQGGSPQLVLQRPDIFNVQCARSLSKACLLGTFVGSEEQKEQISWLDPNSGSTREFLAPSEAGCYNWSLSPDGSLLALIRCGSNKVSFIATKDKSTHEVELKERAQLNTVDWAADGKRVFVVGRNPSGTTTVLDVEPSGRHHVLLEGENRSWFLWAIPAPDGRHVALEELTGENNAWLVENF